MMTELMTDTVELNCIVYTFISRVLKNYSILEEFLG